MFSAHECCALSLLRWCNTITHLFSYIMGRGSNAAMKGSGGGADTALKQSTHRKLNLCQWLVWDAQVRLKF